jgi:hypothetical protein
LPIVDRFQRVNAQATQYFAIAVRDMDVESRMISDPLLENVTAAPDAAHR